LTKTSHNAAHQTSPALWTALLEPPPLGLRGGPDGSTTPSLMCRNVSGFFAVSTE
jgi:hypothetical protein